MRDPESEAIYYHAVARWAIAGYRAFRAWRGKGMSWRTIADRSRHGLFPVAPPPAAPHAKEWERLRAMGIRLILFEDAAYPPLLREIPNPPFGIYVRGALPPADTPHIAMVGTRKPTSEGILFTEHFAETLAAHGVAVTSGLAFGIDKAAHEGALLGKSPTVAVLACGLDAVYPRNHAALAMRILAANGALISEYPPRTLPFPSNFVVRNRIISGLARGAVIIEAPRGSGALQTARFALDQNREVWVTPGPAAHPNFEGSHALLKNGSAALVTSPRDILDALGIAAPDAPTGAAALSGVNEHGALVLRALRARGGTLTIDKIAELTNLKIQNVMQTVTALALRGHVREDGARIALRDGHPS